MNTNLHSMSCPYPEGCNCGASRLNQLEIELNKAKERADLYERVYRESVNACSFMQDENVELRPFGLTLGQRTTVEGVAALRKQRDALKAEVASSKAQLAEAQEALRYYRTHEALTTEQQQRAKDVLCATIIPPTTNFATPGTKNAGLEAALASVQPEAKK
jgi:hypothetical protein